MSCQRCGWSDRVMSISGKCSNMCNVSYNGVEHSGYVPSDINVDKCGDYIEMDFCLECGQIQGTWPIPDPDLSCDDEDSDPVEYIDQPNGLHEEDNPTPTDSDKPAVQLVGRDGNAFAIIGACRSAARTAGWDRERIDAVISEMQDGDYDHLLQVAMKHFDVRQR